MDFRDLMNLEAHGPDTYLGESLDYPWGGLYGGQIVAQALRAAGATVEPRYRPHSLHAYFIRPGDVTEPIRYEVDRLRNGRSFVNRQVVARQSNGAILTMISSFQVVEESAEVQTAVMPEVPAPEALPDDGWSAIFLRRSLPRAEPACERAWFKLPPLDTDDPLIHACGLAYMSDDLPSEPVRFIHPEREGDGEQHHRFMSVSLDHALWFHSAARADEWHLEEITAHRLGGARGMATGTLFTPDGHHAATVAQEALVRPRRQ